MLLSSKTYSWHFFPGWKCRTAFHVKSPGDVCLRSSILGNSNPPSRVFWASTLAALSRVWSLSVCTATSCSFSSLPDRYVVCLTFSKYLERRSSSNTRFCRAGGMKMWLWNRGFINPWREMCKQKTHQHFKGKPTKTRKKKYYEIITLGGGGSLIAKKLIT